MNKYILPLIILIFYACSYSQNSKAKKQNPEDNSKVETSETNEIIDKEVKELKFKEINAQAVLIGEKIELLNKDLKPIDDISDLTGTIVDVVGVSDSLFNNSEDFCNSFWYVKIKSPNKIGIVNGRKVFRIRDSKQDTSFTVNGNHIEILMTEFFGMGVVYQGDLMGCQVDLPIIIKDSENKYYGLVNLIPNEYSKKASWDNEFPFFEIRDDDGAYDKIVSIITEGTKIKLKIHRRWQEGENDFDVLLEYNKGKYTAEYLNIGKIKYE
jgi:hypothetical protein